MFSISRAASRAVPRAACRISEVCLHARAGRLARRVTERAAWNPRAPASRSYSSIAPKTPAASLSKDISKDIAELADAGKWSLVAQGAGLERSFRFKNFTKTWDFMTAVALQCKLKNHHPEWSNVYNTVFVRWTTHSSDGLTAKDVEMARICDGLGKAFGEVEAAKNPSTTSAPSTTPADDAACKMSSLSDTAKGITGGDCCNHTPKSS